jgi:hypothetical protein
MMIELNQEYLELCLLIQLSLQVKILVVRVRIHLDRLFGIIEVESYLDLNYRSELKSHMLILLPKLLLL